MPDVWAGELTDNSKIRHLRKKVSDAAVSQPSFFNIRRIVVSMTIEEAVKKVADSAREYEKELSKTKFLLLCRNIKTNEMDCFEIRFPRYAFLHLTGFELSAQSALKSARDFYNACLEKKLSKKDLLIKDMAYTDKKLTVLPQLINFARYSKMSVVFDGGRPLLRCDKVVGTTNFSIGLDLKKDFYIPVSCLNEDVRNFGKDIFRVLAIFSANLDDTKYLRIRNIAKGIILTDVDIPEDYKTIIDLSDYRTPS